MLLTGAHNLSYNVVSTEKICSTSSKMQQDLIYVNEGEKKTQLNKQILFQDLLSLNITLLKEVVRDIDDISEDLLYIFTNIINI